jgi:glutamine synthetase
VGARADVCRQQHEAVVVTFRNADARPVAEGGDGPRARPIVDDERGGFIERHGLWDESAYAAAAQMRRVMEELGIDMVRMGFVDQHGIVRSKTATGPAIAAALRSGVTVPSSLLLKDTSGRTVFPVFTGNTGVGVGGFAGAGDIVLVPDPTTFRVLPWSANTGSVLCDVRFPDGGAVPFCTRSLLRRVQGPLARLGFGLTVGVELEFHVFRAAGDAMSAERIARPGEPGLPPPALPTTPGAQLLHEETLDSLDDVVHALHRGLTRLDLPLRSIELEFGPSQMEITLAAADAALAADAVVLLRTAIRQICRRHGYHATFMSRPAGSQSASAGWHLHQSLHHLDSRKAVFMPNGPGEVLSETGRHYLGGLIAHASAAAAFTTPTINGYKRYQPLSLAPDRVLWGIDNKGAMVRAIGGVNNPDSRLENRSGEPAANPYLYIASQIISGLDGLERRLDPGPASENPYQDAAPRLPRSLAQALDALDADQTFRQALGDTVVDWYLTIKRAEFDRYLAYVSDWEQREYFGLL